MAISSASTRIFKAEDPVMETDLQLLAKVNEYQQNKFDQGEKQLQDEVNNWSMLSQVAKPQDKEYINGKLNKLVSGIKNMGGVNLSDPNNVNQLKSLGYNMYGDDNVMNPVITTRKMNTLSQNISAKTNGKNAKDYDSVYGEYLMNQYSDWLNDGQQGTSYNGPTDLPQGSFDNYNKKVDTALNKLQPDINDAPLNDKDAALNYYQVGDKFIKKDRINAAIDAVTDGQDKDILSAHAWKSMRGFPDQHIVDLQKNDYNTKIKDMQDSFNYLQYQKSLTTNFKQKQLFDSQMGELKGAIGTVSKQRDGLPTLQDGQQLSKEMRQGLSDNLFFSSFKDQYAAARSYDQKKVELKSNAAAIANQKMAQENYWHGKNYDIQVANLGLREKDFTLKEKEFQLKEVSTFAKLYGAANGNNPFQGPAQNAPLSLMPVKGKDDGVVLNNDIITQADANYTATSKNFYEQGYDYLMSKDPTLYGTFLRQDTDGHWVPKDAKSSDVVNKGLQSFTQMYGGIANMSIKERNGLTLNSDDIELYQRSKDMEEAALYKNQIKNLTSDVFRKAGIEDPSTKTITIPFKDGTKVNLSYAKLKEMADKKDPLLDEWRKNAAPSKGLNRDLEAKQQKDISDLNKNYSFSQRFSKEYQKKLDKIYSNYDISNLGIAKETLMGAISSDNSVDVAVGQTNKYYDNSDVTKAWEDVSKTINPYARVISLPKQKNGKLDERASKILADNITDEAVKSDVNLDAVDLNKVWTVYDPKTLEAKYMGEVRYKKAEKGKDTKGDKGDKYTNVDLTSVVNQQYENGGGWLSNLYSHDNASVVYGLALQNEGKTPFDPKTNFEGALQTHGQGLLSHKYQIVSVQDPKTKGIAGYKVFVAMPLGKDATGNPKFQVLPVPNFLQDASGKTTSFPSNFEAVRAYMEAAFKSTESASDFYTRLGVPWNQ